MSFVFGDLFPDHRSYRPGEVARRLGVHPETVRRWNNDGKLLCMRLGGARRIPYEALQLFVESKLKDGYKKNSAFFDKPL